jgi:hypothetical protein
MMVLTALRSRHIAIRNAHLLISANQFKSDPPFAYGVVDGDGLLDSSAGLTAAVASGEAVGLGAIVSDFRSHATRNAAPVKTQMYLFIYVVKSIR